MNEGLAAQQERGFEQQNYYLGNDLSAWILKDNVVTFGTASDPNPDPDQNPGGITTYHVSVNPAANGTVTASSRTAAPGMVITLTVAPDRGYELESLSARCGKTELKLTAAGDGKYTFLMPIGDVTVSAVFHAKAVQKPFTDVPAGAYYEDAVLWASEQGIVAGTGRNTFDPDGICTRAQAVTFLWRAAGSPAPKSAAMPFRDVAVGSYYYNAVLWAVENGITKGTSDTLFSPDASCSRAQIVTFLWRAQQAPTAGGSNPFVDVAEEAYYYDAVLWAASEGITAGTSGIFFSPDASCTRAQIVSFLYRCEQ